MVFGAPSFTSPLELSSLNGSNGFYYYGIANNDEAGASVASAGDIKWGRQRDDIAIGAKEARFE
ncbi:MAG: hypothetical protein MRQ09_05725 [Candidatus Midichloria sp.]|nr:hypothetical protein [Candidatus Midichloria sp.]